MEAVSTMYTPQKKALKVIYLSNPKTVNLFLGLDIL